MPSSETPIHSPHFRAPGPPPTRGMPPDLLDHPTAEAFAVGTLMLRGADCLTAALQGCTAEAGLNEARFRVLDALHRCSTGECSQNELAEALLQSESNLSTLLERMSGDGLILRRRSETDRRRSLIRITPAGGAALSKAERTRAAVMARVMRQFSGDDADRLMQSLSRLVQRLESSLEVGSRRASGLDPAFGAASVPALPAMV